VKGKWIGVIGRLLAAGPKTVSRGPPKSPHKSANMQENFTLQGGKRRRTGRDLAEKKTYFRLKSRELATWGRKLPLRERDLDIAEKRLQARREKKELPRREKITQDKTKKKKALFFSTGFSWHGGEGALRSSQKHKAWESWITEKPRQEVENDLKIYPLSGNTFFREMKPRKA